MEPGQNDALDTGQAGLARRVAVRHPGRQKGHLLISLWHHLKGSEGCDGWAEIPGLQGLEVA